MLVTKFRKVVSTRITDKEFWGLFFKSHYFYKNRVHTSSLDIFANCEKKRWYGNRFYCK